MALFAYQSTDESINWNLLLIPPENWLCRKVIKVTNGHEDDFWTLKQNLSLRYNRLIVYCNSREKLTNSPIMTQSTVLLDDKSHVCLLAVDGKEVSLFMTNTYILLQCI